MLQMLKYTEELLMWQKIDVSEVKCLTAKEISLIFLGKRCQLCNTNLVGDNLYCDEQNIYVLE
jgi:hypothetical protein